MIDPRDENPCEENNARQEDLSWKVVGLNPGAGKGFFLTKYLFK